MKLINKGVSLILAVLLVLSVCVIPAAAKRGYTTVSDKGIAVQFPDSEDFLPNMKIAKVKASRSNGSIYYMPKPKSGNGNLGNVMNNETVYLIAKSGPYYFFVTEEGHFGWNNAKYFKVRNTVSVDEILNVIYSCGSEAETLFSGDDDFYWFMDQLYYAS